MRRFLLTTTKLITNGKLSLNNRQLDTQWEVNEQGNRTYFERRVIAP